MRNFWKEELGTSGAKHLGNKSVRLDCPHKIRNRDNGKSHDVREAGRLLFFSETKVGMRSYT